MKKYQKAALLSAGALAAGGALFYRWQIRMPLKEFTRYALYMAVLDDEICRNELEGNWIGEQEIRFPPKSESLQYRYHLFLEMNRKKSRKRLLQEISQMESRLAESKIVPCPEGEPLDIGSSPEEAL